MKMKMKMKMRREIEEGKTGALIELNFIEENFAFNWVSESKNSYKIHFAHKDWHISKKTQRQREFM